MSRISRLRRSRPDEFSGVGAKPAGDDGWSADDDAQLGELLGRFAVSAEDGEIGSSDDRLVFVWAQVAAALLRSGRSAGAAAITSGRWMADQLISAAPHLPVRDLPTLRSHYRDLQGDELADALVRNAVLATSGVGIAGGALSAVKWFAPVTLVTVPLQIAVESLAVAAVEIKLVGELHEIYGVPVRGTPTQRGLAYSTAWANRRGVTSLDPSVLPVGLGLVARQRIQRRLLVSVGRGTGTVAPMLLGAAYGGWVNHRTTQSLADVLRADLRRGRPLTGGLAGRIAHGVLSSEPRPPASNPSR